MTYPKQGGEATYPLLVYLSGGTEPSAGSVRIDSQAALDSYFRNVVKPAVDGGITVRIVDTAEICVFHAEKGQIIFPTRQDCAEIGIQ